MSAEASDTIAVDNPVANESVESSPSDGVQGEAAQSDLAVLTSDLQRLQAEYANYRKRVERDRALAHDVAIASVLHEVLPILDDIERARDHAELEGGFKSVADKLVAVVTKLELERFGEIGAEFDPKIHEALMHSTSPEVSRPTATAILQSGYKYKSRVLRPARVAVTDPQ
jgi:molecular chaperone GrpE